MALMISREGEVQWIIGEDRAMRRFGISPEDLHGQKYWDFTEDPDVVRSKFAACTLDREPQEFTHHMRLPDGRRIPCRCWLYPVKRDVDVLCLASTYSLEAASLSREELQVLQRLAEGETYDEIAEAIDVSRTTVERRILNSKRAFRARTVPELIALVVDAGLVTSNPRLQSALELDPCQSGQ